ncbi:MAG: hypothetical protein LBE02_08970 [Spirochaetaceae bacterium]|jgi:hypothetical protein|nr:hypothetical protein [Spirochaetaceae bacterium]
MAFFLICVRLDHDGAILFNAAAVNTVMGILPFALHGAALTAPYKGCRAGRYASGWAEAVKKGKSGREKKVWLGGL